jgi:hypothetical protein
MRLPFVFLHLPKGDFFFKKKSNDMLSISKDEVSSVVIDNTSFECLASNYQKPTKKPGWVFLLKKLFFNQFSSKNNK